MKKILLDFSRLLVTTVVVILALIALRFLWVRYQVDPWTRDGRIRADTVQVAPDVSGLITDVLVHDNQTVRKGEPAVCDRQTAFRIGAAPSGGGDCGSAGASR